MQQGPSATWCSPSGHWSRIDYIVLPLTWKSFSVTARTLPEVETMQKRDDHVPILADLSFMRREPATSYTTNVRTAVRPPLPQTPQERQQVRAHLAAIPAFPWLLDADSHHQCLAASWCHVLKADPQAHTPQPHQPFLSQDTLSVIHLRRALRAYLRQESQERDRRWLLICFAAFRCNQAHVSLAVHALATADAWLTQLDSSEAQALCALHLTCKTIRRKVAADRLAYLDGLATQASTHTLKDPHQLYKAIRRAFPDTKPSRRSAYKPLPSLRLADGTQAASLAERSEGWRSHFAQQEAGTKIDPSAYVRHFSAYGTKPAWDFDIRAVPSLMQTEAVIHSLHARKAAGSDSVSAELLRSDVPSTSRQLLPLLAKSAIRAYEPVAFRGGDLFLLAKRASKVLGCEAYRSILISSVPGKVYHRCLRQQLLPAFEDTRHPLHAGIIAGQGIELISLTAKTFFAMCGARGVPAALVFFDLKAAFYQVIREMLVRTHEDDRGLLELFSHLQLPPDAVTELKHKLCQILLLESSGVSSHSRALISDLSRYVLSAHHRHRTHLDKARNTPGRPSSRSAFCVHFVGLCSRSHASSFWPTSVGRPPRATCPTCLPRPQGARRFRLPRLGRRLLLPANGHQL